MALEIKQFKKSLRSILAKPTLTVLTMHCIAMHGNEVCVLETTSTCFFVKSCRFCGQVEKDYVANPGTLPWDIYFNSAKRFKVRQSSSSI
jgi:hypothetical protein